MLPRLMRLVPTAASRRRALAGLATAALLAVAAGCGGDDDEGGDEAPAVRGVRAQQVKSIRLNTRRPQVEQRIGSPSLDRSQVPEGYTSGEPKKLVCVYYARANNPNGFFQLCYDSRDRLRRVLSIG